MGKNFCRRFPLAPNHNFRHFCNDHPYQSKQKKNKLSKFLDIFSAWDDVGLSEYLCMDQLQLVGRGTSTDQEIPFATCSLATPNTGDYPGLWISGEYMYHGWNEGLPAYQAEPVRCVIADHGLTVQAIQLKVCQNLYGTKDAGVQGGNNITVRMVDEDTSADCETKNLVPKNGLSAGEYKVIDHWSQIGGEYVSTCQLI